MSWTIKIGLCEGALQAKAAEKFWPQHTKHGTGPKNERKEGEKKKFFNNKLTEVPKFL